MSKKYIELDIDIIGVQNDPMTVEEQLVVSNYLKKINDKPSAKVNKTNPSNTKKTKSRKKVSV